MSHKFLKSKKKSKLPLLIGLLALGVLAVICCIGLGKQDNAGLAVPKEATETVSSTEATAIRLPWESDGGKRPEDYTAEDFEMLSPEQQKAFLNYLGKENYEDWLQEAENLPWKQAEAKQPEEYTWAEYQSLSETEKKAFMASLGPYKLETWLQSVGKAGTSEGSSASADSSQTGGSSKTPGSSGSSSDSSQRTNYTLAEYQALSLAEKKAFVNRLGASGFQKWLQQVQGVKVTQTTKKQYPWDTAGAKQPKDYTMEEYEALSAEEKKGFQIHLGATGFKSWQDKINKKDHPWEKTGAKQPQDYTWEEYQALSDTLKKAFQEKLGAAGFVEWKDSFFRQPECPWEKDGAKQPRDYSWGEYKALTADHQYAFQYALGADGMEVWLKSFTSMPWDAAGAVQPEDYSLEEYEKLAEQQQLGFQIHLGAVGFSSWLEEAQKPKEVYPWEKPGAKQPQNYTMAEYDALTAGQQMAFQMYMGSDAFEAWLNQPEPNPWDQPDSKQPQDYTLAEYNALTAGQQMAFHVHLGADAFAAWQQSVQEKPAANPWDAAGAKQPQDYTMAEFSALTQDQQMAFQNHLGAEGFEAWMLQNRQDQQQGDYPWNQANAKQPQDYTMAEFNALTVDQQMAFQDHLGAEGFASWLSREQPGQSQGENPWDAPDGKQPMDYTWEEFNALTGAQQMAFQNHLGAEGFDAWLSGVLPGQSPVENPWDAPDARQPVDYTWEEFDALTGPQQMAFQNHLGAEGFEAWLNRVLEQPKEEASVDTQPLADPQQEPASRSAEQGIEGEPAAAAEAEEPTQPSGVPTDGETEV